MSTPSMNTSLANIKVWDLPVRVGHWLLVAAFATAWLTGESEAWRLVHAMAGGTLVGVIGFRLLWGIVGTLPARFSRFVRGPHAVFAYVRSLLARTPAHHTGHNPAGGWAIVLLLVLGLLAGVTGWGAYQDTWGDWLGELHEGLTAAMLTLVIVHVAGVIVSSRLHGENLARAMLTGNKLGHADEAIPGTRLWAVPILLAAAAAGAWYLSR